MWKGIWNKNERINKIILEMLIKADGFDSGAGSFDVDDWKEYTNEFYAKLNIQNSDSVFEIGCGSGAFLYPLYLQGNRVGGVDYSSVLIELANKIMPQANCLEKEAINIDDSSYDFIISHGVFHYFESLEYAKLVIEKMIKKANKKIAILDINDKAKEDIYHKTRMGAMSKEQYQEKYKDLDHTFYDKDWFVSIAKEFGLKVEIFDQDFENYTNSKLRFNVIMEKS